jgi:DNA-binding response OmpR family regulator
MALSRDLLLARVWGDDFIGDARTVDVHIRWLRGQLEGEPDGSQLIETVHGVGYRFAGDLGPRFQEHL